MTQDAFDGDADGLQFALDQLLDPDARSRPRTALPARLPAEGIGARNALRVLAPALLTDAAKLGAPTAFAHMDPPTPWITWAVSQWTASTNQNLLHPATAPAARELERLVIDWLAPLFGMTGGHMTPGSTVANLTGLWAARQSRGVRRVVASEEAHLSVRKAADLLALDYLSVRCDADGGIDGASLPPDLSGDCLVLTAGSTGRGAIDNLQLGADAGWTHVDAAWAGPLRLSPRHAAALEGIERADSVAISAHKWLFQPKESALVLFSNAVESHAAISYGGSYLAAPNVGLLGSHGATAAPLLATLLAYGRTTVARWIDEAMAHAQQLAEAIDAHPALELLAPAQTGVVVWRPRQASTIDDFFDALPKGSTSRTSVGGTPWLRNVAANPRVDIESVVSAIELTASALAAGEPPS
jgi:L-2,4-diaminobutyrate decarboxylase